MCFQCLPTLKEVEETLHIVKSNYFACFLSSYFLFFYFVSTVLKIKASIILAIVCSKESIVFYSVSYFLLTMGVSVSFCM